MNHTFTASGAPKQVVHDLMAQFKDAKAKSPADGATLMSLRDQVLTRVMQEPEDNVVVVTVTANTNITVSSKKREPVAEAVAAKS